MSEMTGFSQWPDDDYADIVEDVAQEWGRARRTAVQLGVKADQIIFDPGLGFSKNARHSYVLLGQLRRFRELGAPVLVGPGRKSFLAASDGAEPAKRLGGTIAASVLAALGGADLLRVHDVFDTRQALAVLACSRDPNRATVTGPGGEPTPLLPTKEPP
jgi:dihydropteroate synthase